jgi:hypothetical protein
LAPPDDDSGLAAGGGVGSGLTAGRAGSADLPAHAEASTTTAINDVARIHDIIVIIRIVGKT